MYLPFALPCSLGHAFELGFEAVDVVADVARVTQNESSFVVALATPLANRAIQTAPALAQHNLRKLPKYRCVKNHKIKIKMRIL